MKSRGTELNDRLRDYATEKFTKVQRFFERIIKMEVELSEERNPRVKDGHKVEVTVKTPGDTLRASGAGADFFTAIDQAADRLEIQVKKAKDRLNRRGHHPEPPPPAVDVGEQVDPDGGPVIVPVPMQLAKPMTPEEAVMELEERGMQFMMFTNAETMAVGVIYRRGDGAYGLIENR